MITYVIVSCGEKMSKSGFIEFLIVTLIFLFVLPVMFTLMVAVLLNSAAVPEVRIAQAGVIVLVSGLILYGSVSYFLRKLIKGIESYQEMK
jgi:uncharacterized membrane protein